MLLKRVRTGVSGVEVDSFKPGFEQLRLMSFHSVARTRQRFVFPLCLITKQIVRFLGVLILSVKNQAP